MNIDIYGNPIANNDIKTPSVKLLNDLIEMVRDECGIEINQGQAHWMAKRIIKEECDDIYFTATSRLEQLANQSKSRQG